MKPRLVVDGSLAWRHKTQETSDDCRDRTYRYPVIVASRHRTSHRGRREAGTDGGAVDDIETAQLATSESPPAAQRPKEVVRGKIKVRKDEFIEDATAAKLPSDKQFKARLPFTVFNSTAQLPLMADYNLTGYV